MVRAASFAGLLTLALFVGCGDDSSSSSSSSTSSNSSSSAPAAPTMSSTQAAETTTTSESSYDAAMQSSSTSSYDSTMTPSDPYASNYGANPQQPQLPKRPENIEDWTADHITSAIIEGDRKAVQAIRQYSEEKFGDPAAVAQILSWLQTFNDVSASKTPPTGSQPGYDSSYPSSYPTSDPAAPGEAGASLDRFEGSPNRFANVLASTAVTWYDEAPASYPTESYSDPNMMYNSGQQGAPVGRDAIGKELVEALVSTRTLEGYATAREILKGKVLTNVPDDKVVLWTISALMKNIDGPYSPAKKILRQTLLEPELFRSEEASADRYNAEELAKKSLLLHTAFSEAMVDGYFGVPEGKKSKPAQNPNPYSTGESMPMESTPYTTDPALSNPNAQPAAQANAEPQLPKIKVPDVSLTPEQGRGAAYYFWESEFQNYSRGELQRVARFGQFPEAFLLAGQMPSAESRKLLREFLEANWEQDPGWLKEQQVFSEHWRDPALLVLLKSLPREPRPAPVNTSDGNQPNNRRPSRDKDTPAQKAAKHGWFDASQDFVLATMDRLGNAGFANPDSTYSDEELGIKLHKDAPVVAQFRLKFPPENDDLGAFAHLEPTTVNYVRIESTAMDERTVKHYETAIKNEEKRVILGNNGMWLDGAPRRDRVAGTVTITDIVLSQNNARGRLSAPDATQTPAASATPESYNAGQPGQTPGGVFVVEIMTITIPDPLAKPAAEPAAVSEKN